MTNVKKHTVWVQSVIQAASHVALDSMKPLSFVRGHRDLGINVIELSS
jgi:hypothetical protein